MCAVSPQQRNSYLPLSEYSYRKKQIKNYGYYFACHDQPSWPVSWSALHQCQLSKALTMVTVWQQGNSITMQDETSPQQLTLHSVALQHEGPTSNAILPSLPPTPFPWMIMPVYHSVSPAVGCQKYPLKTSLKHFKVVAYL